MKACREDIHLDIRNRTGSVEHYFHFLTGFLVPLVLEHKKLHEDTKEKRFYTRSCSIMDPHIREMGLENLHLVDKEAFAARNDLLDTCAETNPLKRRVVCHGYDSPEYYERSAFDRAKSIMSDRLRHPIADFRSRFEGNGTATDRNIVLINREAPHPFYDSDRCETKGAGTSRGN
jgi:hypothetical protein